MTLGNATANAYKTNIEIKEKKLSDAVTSEQKIVIQQDLDKLKEKHENHVKAVEKDFDEQIKAAPKEVKEKLNEEKEAFKSKYVAKEVKKTDVKNGGSQNINTDVKKEESDNKDVGSDATVTLLETNPGTAVENVEKITSGKYYGFTNLTLQKFYDAKYFENFCQDAEKTLVNTKEIERTDDNTNYEKEESDNKAENECVTNINKLFGEINKVGKFLAAKNAEQNFMVEAAQKVETATKVETAQKEASNAYYYYTYVISFFIDNSKNNAKSAPLVKFDKKANIDMITEEINKLIKNCVEGKNICELNIISKLWEDVQIMQNKSTPTVTDKNTLNGKITSYEQEFNKCKENEIDLDSSVHVDINNYEQ